MIMVKFDLYVQLTLKYIIKGSLLSIKFHLFLVQP